jgi:RNA polymerase sigma-70 factor (ECF subfamily)
MMSDRELLQRARLFDEFALAEIYDVHSPGIYRYAMRLLGDVDLAEECVSETFSRFLCALQANGGPHECLKAYLYRIAHNWITDHYRRQPRQPLPLDLGLPGDRQEEPPQYLAGELERQQVRAALALLTPEQRQVLVLKYLEDWKTEEVAQALDKSIWAVKALQHRALAALRRLMPREEYFDG